MNWNCGQLELRLSDYLDGTLTPAEQEAAEAHVAGCVHCAQWLAARRAVLWLEQVEALPTPPGLETRILAHTTGLAPRLSIWEILANGWRALAQPRVALSVAAALFSLAIVLQAFDINVREFSAGDFRPSNIYRKFDRTMHVAYGRGVKFINDLRLVYEIRSRLEQIRPASEQPAEQKPPTPETPKKEEKNYTDDGGTRKFYAYHWPLRRGRSDEMLPAS